MEADEILGSRWTLSILRVLIDGPIRFSRLKRSVSGLSAKMLVNRLCVLEEAGIVERAWLPQPADCQVYRMTDAGLATRELVEAIDAWSRSIQSGAPPPASA